MKKEIDLLDLFSGTGGFALGFENAGYTIKNHYFSEVDKHAIANYKYNFKNAKYVGSVTDVRDINADVITFGSPCQDFSISGQRKGLDGKRSSLIWEPIRIISEKRPSVFIWENVKGTFSSNNGADFWAILAAFANIGGYRLEWQLLNTKWFLPQNRERIYLVGHLAGRSKPGVFPFTENDRLFTEPQKAEKRQLQTQISTTIGTKAGMRADSTFIIPKHAGTLTAGANSGGLHSDMTVIPVEKVSIKQRPRGNNKGGSFNECPTISTKSFEHNNHLVIEKGLVQKPETKGNPQGTRVYETNGISLTISSGGGGLGGKTGLYDVGDLQIRRLTEIECERLQGFPDDHTKYGYYLPKKIENHLKRKKRFTHPDLYLITYCNALMRFKSTLLKEIPQTQRYKMIGNAVSEIVVRSVAERLEIV